MPGEEGRKNDGGTGMKVPSTFSVAILFFFFLSTIDPLHVLFKTQHLLSPNIF